MNDDKNKLDWQYRKSGLYLPKDVPDGGKKIVGFARALEENKLEEKVEKGDIENKLQKMSSVETNKRLSPIQEKHM